jgi:transposase
MLAPTLPDLSRLDREALQELLLAEHRERVASQERLLSRESEIEHLRLLLAQLRRMQFGRKSEKLTRQIEQLELRLEDLRQTKPVESAHLAESQLPPTASAILTSAVKPVRRPLPDHLPRTTQTHYRNKRHARAAVESCARWEKMFPRCWSTCQSVSG